MNQSREDTINNFTRNMEKSQFFGNDYFSTEDEMNRLKEKSDNFLEKYKAYYDYRINDEAITDEVTQSFYQSMYLSRNKLQDNGLTIHYDTQYLDQTERESGILGKPDEVFTFKTPILVKKSFVQNGKNLNTKKAKLIALSNVKRAKGIEESVACPKCGHLGKLSSYIDGCDYCGSKYSVLDFKEKITAFSICEDVKKKSSQMIKNFFKILGISILLFIALIVIGFAGLILSTLAGASNKTSFSTGFMFLLSMKMVPVLIITFLILGIIFLIVWGKFLAYAYIRVDKNNVLDTIKAQYYNFSEDKFAEDLEYKLRNIHFAKTASEINVFSHTGLQMAIDNYKNVIECDLQKIRFLGFDPTNVGCHIRVKAKLRLTKIVGNKIKEDNETVTLVVSYKNEAIFDTDTELCMHTCSNCGSTISLLNGGVCEHCGQQLDYEKYSFIIETYYSNYKNQIKDVFVKFGNNKEMGLKARVRLMFFACVFVAVLIGGVSIKLSIGNYIKMFFNYDYYENLTNEEFDSIATLDKKYTEFTLKDKSFGDMERTYTYEYKQEYATLLDEYINYLGDNKFISSYNNDTEHVYKRLTTLGEDFDFDVFFIVSVEINENEVTIFYSMEDTGEDPL